MDDEKKMSWKMQIFFGVFLFLITVVLLKVGEYFGYVICIGPNGLC